MECPYCHAEGSFENDQNGVPVCARCGHQLEHIISQASEYNLLYNTRGRVRVKREDTEGNAEELYRRTSKTKNAENEGLRTKALLKAYTHLLKCLAKSLVERTGCTEKLVDVAGSLWIKYLKVWRSTGWAEDQLHTDFSIRRSQAIHTELRRLRGMGTPYWKSGGEEKSNQLKRQVSRKLSETIPLDLVCLSCQYLRVGILPIDIWRMAFHNLIPWRHAYFNLPKVVQDGLWDSGLETIFYPYNRMPSFKTLTFSIKKTYDFAVRGRKDASVSRPKVIRKGEHEKRDDEARDLSSKASATPEDGGETVSAQGVQLPARNVPSLLHRWCCALCLGPKVLRTALTIRERLFTRMKAKSRTDHALKLGESGHTAGVLLVMALMATFDLNDHRPQEYVDIPAVPEKMGKQLGVGGEKGEGSRRDEAENGADQDKKERDDHGDTDTFERWMFLLGESDKLFRTKRGKDILCNAPKTLHEAFRIRDVFGMRLRGMDQGWPHFQFRNHVPMSEVSMMSSPESSRYLEATKTFMDTLPAPDFKAAPQLRESMRWLSRLENENELRQPEKGEQAQPARHISDDEGKEDFDDENVRPRKRRKEADAHWIRVWDRNKHPDENEIKMFADRRYRKVLWLVATLIGEGQVQLHLTTHTLWRDFLSEVPSEFGEKITPEEYRRCFDYLSSLFCPLKKSVQYSGSRPNYPSDEMIFKRVAQFCKKYYSGNGKEKPSIHEVENFLATAFGFRFYNRLDEIKEMMKQLTDDSRRRRRRRR